MKKLLALTLGMVMALTAAGASFAGETEADVVIPSDMKVGFIFLHDENSTYDLNFIKIPRRIWPMAAALWCSRTVSAMRII